MVQRWGQGNSERGQASMVTVAMFMMLFAVVAVSFTYIVVTASRQATNDSIQSAAKAAAESGVEDAKRLLVYCYSQQDNDSSDVRALCDTVIGKRIDDASMTCTTILGAVKNSGIASQFALENDEQGGYRVQVGGDGSATGGSNNEYYQCLKIATKSKSYESVVNGGGTSAIIPLKLVDSDDNPGRPTEITVKWHRGVDGSDGDRDASGIDDSESLPTASSWLSSGSNRPAMLRVEQVGASKTSVSIDDLIANDVAVTLRPSRSGSSSINFMQYQANFNTNQTDTAANSGLKNGSTPLVKTKCYNPSDSKPSELGDYDCMMKFTSSGALDLTNMDYYLRLNAIYKSTHFAVSAKDAAGNDLYFDGVQPVIDVTGKSADSFSRIQARLKPLHSDDDDSIWYPEYAIETGGKVCKNMNVFYDYGTDECNY